MPLNVKATGGMPRAVWDIQAMRTLATLCRSAVVLRTQELGLGEDGRPLRPYSTTRLKLYYRTGTAKRLKPKGGRPFAWVRGPRMDDGRYDSRKIGQEGGRIYSGGYAAFKQASRKGVTGAEVDLTLSGQMMRQLRVLRVEQTTATIGLSGQSRTYGPFVDARRPFLGLSPRDKAELHDEFVRLQHEAAARSVKKGGGNGAK